MEQIFLSYSFNHQDPSIQEGFLLKTPRDEFRVIFNLLCVYYYPSWPAPGEFLCGNVLKAAFNLGSHLQKITDLVKALESVQHLSFNLN